MKYYIDGFTLQSNPSPLGGGYSVIDEDNNLVKVEVIQKRNFTNNEAEVLGIKYAVENLEPTEVFTDSRCAMAWVKNGKSKARPDLKNILLELKQLVQEKEIVITYVSREKNLAGIWNEENENKDDFFQSIMN